MEHFEFKYEKQHLVDPYIRHTENVNGIFITVHEIKTTKEMQERQRYSSVILYIFLVFLPSERKILQKSPTMLFRNFFFAKLALLIVKKYRQKNIENHQKMSL